MASFTQKLWLAHLLERLKSPGDIVDPDRALMLPAAVHIGKNAPQALIVLESKPLEHRPVHVRKSLLRRHSRVKEPGGTGEFAAEINLVLGPRHIGLRVKHQIAIA